MAKLSQDVRAHLRFFAYFLANGAVQVHGLVPIDYRSEVTDPSTLEQVFAIWSNVLEIDGEGRVLNEHVADQRAAQHIRQQADRAYVIDPPLAQWEVELYL
jgi:hypothetical protein